MRARIRDLAERLSGLPLRWQIGTLVLVGLLGIFILFGLLGSAIAADAKQRTIGEWLSVTTSTARFIDSEIEAQFQRLERAAALVGQSAGDPARQRRVLDDSFGPPETLVAGAVLFDSAGSAVWSTPDAHAPAGDAAVEPYVRGPLSTRARFASGVQRSGDHATVILAVPVFGLDRATVGVLAMTMRPDQGVIQELVASARGLAMTGHAELVDQDDRVIASSESGHVLRGGEHPDFYEPLLAGHRSDVGLTAPVGPADPADRGQRHEMAFVPLQSAPWGLALGGSDAELSASANRWTEQIVLFGALSLGVALLLVWLTTRSVARPILALAAASREIAAGDLNTPIPHGGEGEVRVLAQAFDDMRRELQSALADLALEKSRYEGIVASMADAVVTTDAGLRISAINPSAAALMGWSAAEALGRHCCEVICVRGASPQDCGTRCPFAAPEPDLGVAKETLRRRDGGEVTVAVTRSAIRDRSGGLAGIVHVLRDVSAEAEVERLKDEFLATVSHELRTPLGFIMGYATTLLLPDAPRGKRAVRRCIEVIADASKELEGLVDDLLDMTRIGARSLSVSPADTPFGPLATAAVERIRARGSDHRFVTKVPASLPVIRADSHRVEQVLYNLLDNAMKYAPGGGDVTVEAAAGEREVVVGVVDEGLGIPPGELAGVFERFRRGAAARTRGIAGTGLGLAICKGIVEAHGGRIWAESPPAGAVSGTAIRFTLPLAATAPAVRRATTVAAAAAVGT